MPVYEFVCRRCDHPFEELVIGSERPRCPACESEDLAKRWSTFATRGAEPARPAGPAPSAPCGSCGDPRGPGACAAG
jgi:putative FmdB family regulatory protein